MSSFSNIICASDQTVQKTEHDSNSPMYSCILMRENIDTTNTRDEGNDDEL